MVERGFGRIIFVISDTLWKPPTPVLLPHVASKGGPGRDHADPDMTLGPGGIVVGAVALGLTDTPGSRTVNTDEQFEGAVNNQALKRRLTSEDTAAAVAVLSSEGAADMTGQVLCADGGFVGPARRPQNRWE